MKSGVAHTMSSSAINNNQTANIKRSRSISPVPGWNSSSKSAAPPASRVDASATRGRVGMVSAANKASRGPIDQYTKGRADSVATTGTPPEEGTVAAHNEQLVTAKLQIQCHKKPAPSVEELLAEISALKQCFSAVGSTMMTVLNQTTTLDSTQCQNLLAVAKAHYTPKYYLDI